MRIASEFRIVARDSFPSHRDRPAGSCRPGFRLRRKRGGGRGSADRLRERAAAGRRSGRREEILRRSARGGPAGGPARWFRAAGRLPRRQRAGWALDPGPGGGERAAGHRGLRRGRLSRRARAEGAAAVAADRRSGGDRRAGRAFRQGGDERGRQGDRRRRLQRSPAGGLRRGRRLMGEERPRVSVVVPTRDRPQLLRRCLAALEAQTLPVEVVVVEDSEGRGPAWARNEGVRRASGEVVCFTDDDCAPVPGWAEALAGPILAGEVEATSGPVSMGEGATAADKAWEVIVNYLQVRA